MTKDMIINKSIKVNGNVVEQIYSTESYRYKLGINKYYRNAYDNYDCEFVCFLSDECIQKVMKAKTLEGKLEAIKEYYPDVNYFSF